MASWTTPTTFATGDILDVGSVNAIANDLTFLYEAPYVYAYASASVGIASGTATPAPLSATVFSGYGASVNSSNVVVPLTGIYQVSFCAYVFAVSDSYSMNGMAYHQGSLAFNGSTNATGITFSTGSGLISASASDSIGLWANQTTGSSQTIESGAQTTFLSAYFVGSQ